jgi:hypothetical protein
MGIDLYHCETCNLSFSSWKEMKEHFISAEHREKAKDPLLRSEQLLNQIAKKLCEPEKEHGSN